VLLVAVITPAASAPGIRNHNRGVSPPAHFAGSTGNPALVEARLERIDESENGCSYAMA
jgi:hypothetical protein